MTTFGVVAGMVPPTAPPEPDELMTVGRAVVGDRGKANGLVYRLARLLRGKAVIAAGVG